MVYSVAMRTPSYYATIPLLEKVKKLHPSSPKLPSYAFRSLDLMEPVNGACVVVPGGKAPAGCGMRLIATESRLVPLTPINYAVVLTLPPQVSRTHSTIQVVPTHVGFDRAIVPVLARTGCHFSVEIVVVVE
jgi:hypothetical protein